MKSFEHASGYELVRHIQQNFHGNLVGIEIGCAEGTTTECYLELFKNLRLYGIDPYTPFVDWNGVNIHEGVHQYAYDKFREKVDRFGDRFVHIKDYSDNVHNKFADHSLDFIFVDGLHTYDQVLKDCNNYWNKVRPGGLFAGHDYNIISGVKQAVNEFAQSLQIEKIYVGTNDVWYWFKK